MESETRTGGLFGHSRQLLTALGPPALSTYQEAIVGLSHAGEPSVRPGLLSAQEGPLGKGFQERQKCLKFEEHSFQAFSKRRKPKKRVWSSV